jgi:glucokinase
MIHQAIGIDLGGTSAKIGVVENAQVIHREAPVITKDHTSVEALMSALTERINHLKKQFPHITSVGFGVPGFVDAETGLVHELTNIPGWHDVYVGRLISEKTGLPCVADNDANCMGLAELHHGAGRNFKNFIAITLGTGVGGAVIIDRRLFRGSRSGAGEVGQMSIHYAGVSAPHGNTGALERYVGNKQVAERAQALYAAAGSERPLSECSPALLAQRAPTGDEIAIRVWDEFTTQLACALANCAWLLNPDAFVIGGGIAAAGDIIFGPLRKKMEAQLATTFKEHLQIVPAHFGNDAGLIGAACLAIQETHS